MIDHTQGPSERKRKEEEMMDPFADECRLLRTVFSNPKGFFGQHQRAICPSSLSLLLGSPKFPSDVFASFYNFCSTFFSTLLTEASSSCSISFKAPSVPFWDW